MYDSYETPSHVCSCIMAWDFERTRNLNWERDIAPIAFEEHLGRYPDGTYSNRSGGGDQDFLYALTLYRPELKIRLDKSWNLTNSRKFYDVPAKSEKPDSTDLFAGTVHFNCMDNQYTDLKGWEWLAEFYKW